MAGAVTVLALVTGVTLDLWFPGRPYGLIGLGVAGASAVLWAVICRGSLSGWLGRRSTRLGANTAVIVIATVAILAMINVLAVRHSARVDLSQTGAFTLAPQTIKVLDALPKDVKVTGFFQKGSEPEAKFKDLIETYRHRSAKISGEAIDPDTHPAAAKQYGITQYDTVVIESGSREARIRTVDEQEITNALIRVGKDRKKHVAVLDGHGEPSVDDKEPTGFSQVKEGLEREGYQVAPLLLAQTGTVPPETAVVIIADPQKPLLPAEEEALSRYASDGGRLLLLLGPGTKSGAERLTERWGVRFRGDTIIDPVARLFGEDYTTPLIRTYSEHDIVKDFRLATFFPLAQSLTFDTSKNSTVDYQPLAMTSPDSWGETQIIGGKARYDPGRDTRGPMDVAAAISEKKALPTPSEGTPDHPASGFSGVLVGNAAFATNRAFNKSGNGDFLLSAVHWLTEERDLIAIRPKEAASSPLFLTAGQKRAVFWIPVVVIPGIVTIFGLTVWRRRRRL